MGHCWGWGPGTFFAHPFGLIVGVLFWALMLHGLFVVILNIKRGPCRADSVATPMDILKRRYARGEINQEEFVRMKMDLEN